ncbi:MAG TPA: VOC family protein [Candidatus Didemnitutus sp.]
MSAKSNFITPCLWFNGDAEEAVAFYVTLVPNSRLDRVWRTPADTPNVPAGKVLTVEFTLGDTPFLALNGGPEFSFTAAVSFQIHCDTQAEVDRIWAAILEGGKEMACGWIQDRWGLAWQVVPRRLTELLSDPDPARAKRAMIAMMDMVKIDIAALNRAADATD